VTPPWRPICKPWKTKPNPGANRLRPRQKAGSNAPSSFDLRGELYRISGSDLTEIDGINIMNAQTIIAEVGVDMSRFPSEAHFASFLGLCPNNQTTGGKVLRRGTKHVQNRAATALRMAATGLWRSKTYFGSQLSPSASPSGGTESHHGHGTHASPARLPHAALRRTIRRQGIELLRREISRAPNPQHSEKGKRPRTSCHSHPRPRVKKFLRSLSTRTLGCSAITLGVAAS
jgi:hypothetical protein